MNPILKSIIQKKRREFEELAAKQRIPEHALDGVRQGRSIRYHQGGDSAHVMDLYCPTTVQTPTPVIINIHGGGSSPAARTSTGISVSTSVKWALSCFPLNTACVRR